jgi:hypothetical protein
MSKYFHTGQIKPNSAVIYRYEVNHSGLESDLILQHGYMNAANIIIESLKNQNSIEAHNDCLVYPLLNIYCCVFEFLFKATLKELARHKNACICKFLNQPPLDISKILEDHDLSRLSNAINQILNGIIKQQPHNFDAWPFISGIIEELTANGIDIYSARYHHKKITHGGSIYSLYGKQQNIRLYKLHEDIEKAARLINSYINHDKFQLCQKGYFSHNGLNVLKEIYRICKKHEELFKSLQIDTENNSPSTQMFLTGDDWLNTLQSHNSKAQIEFNRKIASLPVNEQDAILKCLYTATRPIDIAVPLHKKVVTEDRLREEILGREHSYMDGLKKLKDHIRYIENFSNLY